MGHEPSYLHEEQIFLIKVLPHLLLDKLLTELEITDDEHLVEEPVEI